jgi:hypothetical protein
MQQLRGVPMRDLILLMLALGVLVTFNVLRTEEQPEPSSLLDSYSTFDAGSGGYRAWYELLQREHVAVDQFQQRPAFLDHSASTLVWAEPIAFDPRQTQNTKDDITALERWVKAGGRFIYLGHDETAAKAGVLKLPATSSAGSPRALSIASALRATGIRRVALTTHLRWKLPTKLAATALIADASGPLAVTYRYGAGTIVALVDEAAFDNAHIAQTDNARLALALTGASVGAGTVAFDETAHGYLIPEHWWQIVPRRLLVGVLLALGAFGIALFGSAIRLGPPIVPPRRRHRPLDLACRRGGLRSAGGSPATGNRGAHRTPGSSQRFSDRRRRSYDASRRRADAPHHRRRSAATTKGILIPWPLALLTSPSDSAPESNASSSGTRRRVSPSCSHSSATDTS